MATSSATDAAVFSRVAGQHVTEGVGAVVRNARRLKREANNLAHGFGSFPVLSRVKPLAAKPELDFAVIAVAGNRRIVEAVERHFVTKGHPIRKGGFQRRSNSFGKEGVDGPSRTWLPLRAGSG